MQGGQELLQQLVQPDTGILRLQHLLRDGLLLPAGMLQHTGGIGGTGAHEPSSGLSTGDAAEEEHATKGQGGPGSAGKQAGGSARNRFLASVKAKVLDTHTHTQTHTHTHTHTHTYVYTCRRCWSFS